MIELASETTVGSLWTSCGIDCVVSSVVVAGVVSRPGGLSVCVYLEEVATFPLSGLRDSPTAIEWELSSLGSPLPHSPLPSAESAEVGRVSRLAVLVVIRWGHLNFTKFRCWDCL